MNNRTDQIELTRGLIGILILTAILIIKPEWLLGF